MNKKTLQDSTILKAKILSYGFTLAPEIQDVIDNTVKEEHRGYGDSHWGFKKLQKYPVN